MRELVQDLLKCKMSTTEIRGLEFLLKREWCARCISLDGREMASQGEANSSSMMLVIWGWPCKLKGFDPISISGFTPNVANSLRGFCQKCPYN
jgi:hypothetical protein